MRDAEVNVAYRWFLGYTMSQQLPHFANHQLCIPASIYRRSNRRRVPVDTGRSCPGRISVCGSRVCGWNTYQSECEPEKANEKGHPVAAKRYQEQLDEEIEADRAAHGKKPLKKDEDDDHPAAPGKQKMVAESTTDPESGVFHKGEHRKCFAYEAHTVCDRRGYILETEITPGNVHDSVAFDAVFERLKMHYPKYKSLQRMQGTKRHGFAKQIFDSGKIPSLPYKRPMTKKGELTLVCVCVR